MISLNTAISGTSFVLEACCTSSENSESLIPGTTDAWMIDNLVGLMVELGKSSLIYDQVAKAHVLTGTRSALLVSVLISHLEYSQHTTYSYFPPKARMLQKYFLSHN